MADALVVGAGHNGLVAANLLADAGWDVIVLERNSRPGGSVRSDVLEPGYTFDLCSAFFPLAAASPVFASLGLEEHGLVWRRSPAVLGHALADGRSAVLHPDPAQTANSLNGFARQDGVAWQRLCRQWEEIAAPFLRVLFEPFPPVRPAERLVRRTGVSETMRLLQMSAGSVREFTETVFGGEGARSLLTSCALHSDVSPEGTGSAIYGWLLAMIGQQMGFPVPAGGTSALTNALVARLHSRGGQVVCGHPVASVLIANNRAVGVREVGGRVWPARRAVLADVVASRLYTELVGVERLPVAFVNRLRAFRAGFPVLKVNWALSSRLPWTNAEMTTPATIHIGGDTSTMTHWCADLAAGDVPQTPFMVAGQMSVADPQRCPPGCETLWAYTHLPRDLGDARGDDGPIQETVQRMEDLFSAHAPGWRGSVVHRQVQAPADFAAMNSNMVDGALDDGTASPWQQLVFRPVPGLGRADTPVDRLFLAGASAHPGPGVHGGCGANAAKAALARDGALGFAYRGVLALAQRLLY